MKKILSVSLLLTTGIFLSSCGGSHTEKALPSTEERIPVTVVEIGKYENAHSISATGLLSTENEAKYSFKIGGVIDRITIDEGEFFRKGQLLATLKLTEIQAQLSQANLGFEKAKRDYTRTLNLYRDSVATLEQLQNAKTGLDIAEKSIDAITFNRQYANIYANADGFVTKKLANEGEVVSGGAAILAINQTKSSNDWILKVGVSDKEWSATEAGNTASVTLDAFPGKTFPGMVFRKSQAADQTNGSFQVEVKMNLSGVKPAIGMFGKADIHLSRKNILPVIPYGAIVEADGNSAFVFVPIDSSRVKRLPITIESFNNNEVVVKSGLENVSSIVVSNSPFLNEKSIIKIIK